ncbi:methyl-accepting chemotaxis protein [Sporosarcina sp. GW1-11]|uniref:methyl-accepting chemotaxis protein n=1 Tax=Sporosarcina sp. GW1-11 TaxID=2899126 RepID=UPI00294D650F|nr:methyl-accepting chemotaxis protein [Sporosarcina sp. GW1-11]MDV6378006.1 methyl-accepting chemotaxis protein [Sporosarcina sp. GW1-11]
MNNYKLKLMEVEKVVKFTVGRKLWVGFLSVGVIMILIGTIGFLSLKNVNEKYQFLIDDRMYKVILLEQQLRDQNMLGMSIRGFMLYGSEEYLTDIEEARQNNQDRLNELDKIIHDQVMKNSILEIREATDKYNEFLQDIIAEKKKGNDERVLQIGRNGVTYQFVISDNIHTLIEYYKDQQDVMSAEVKELTKNATLLMIGLIILGMIASIVTSIIISRLISRPVSHMTEALAEVSAGNFSIEKISIKNRDEIGEMATALNAMVVDLRGIIQRARDSAIKLAVQSEELSASSEESLAASEMVAEISEKNLQTSEKQSQIVNQSTASMEEMVTAIDGVTHDNEEMLKSSEDVAQLVKEGSTLMNETTEQMNYISETIGESIVTINEMAKNTANIRNVTSIITAIAEQTNLLALNAAIEAARAGEHGKGFAVVAEEVRNLAEQSKRSTEEIGRMVDTIIEDVSKVVDSTDEGHKRVEEGLAFTKKTNSIFESIEYATSDVSGKIATVSSAIEEIRAMTDEVAFGARQVEELAIQASAEAQSTSAATEEQLAANEEITSSSQTLAQLAEQLQNDMGRFKV